jgi:hypothetical protein
MGFRRRVPLVAAAVAAVLLAGCGTGPSSSPRPGPSGRSGPATVIPTASQLPPPSPASTPSPHPTGPPAALPVAPGAGSLPQTRAFPSTRSIAFRNAMTDLWLAVTTGDSRLALPAFFPLAAYQQVKAIADPGSDWHHRLWYDFTLDVGAAHSLVGHGAHLIRVIVPDYDAAWVYPGACYNSVGYWHAPGARVVYQQRGQERSFGIASLISWRGVWYVVHLGAVLRSAVTGVVDQPAVGPGMPGPAGGC